MDQIYYWMSLVRDVEILTLIHCSLKIAHLEVDFLQAILNLDDIFITCYYCSLFFLNMPASHSLAGGGQQRSVTLAWCHQTFRVSATTSVISPCSSSAPTTTTGSTRAVFSPTWRMTRTSSRVRSTSTKPSRKVIPPEEVSFNLMAFQGSPSEAVGMMSC